MRLYKQNRGESKNNIMHAINADINEPNPQLRLRTIKHADPKYLNNKYIRPNPYLLNARATRKKAQGGQQRAHAHIKEIPVNGGAGPQPAGLPPAITNTVSANPNAMPPPPPQTINTTDVAVPTNAPATVPTTTITSAPTTTQPTSSMAAPPTAPNDNTTAGQNTLGQPGASTSNQITTQMIAPAATFQTVPSTMPPAPPSEPPPEPPAIPPSAPPASTTGLTEQTQPNSVDDNPSDNVDKFFQNTANTLSEVATEAATGIAGVTGKINEVTDIIQRGAKNFIDSGKQKYAEVVNEGSGSSVVDSGMKQLSDSISSISSSMPPFSSSPSNLIDTEKSLNVESPQSKIKKGNARNAEYNNISFDEESLKTVTLQDVNLIHDAPLYKYIQYRDSKA